MNIKYNESDNTIEIKDRLKSVYWYQRISAIFIIIAAMSLSSSVWGKDLALWTVFIWGFCVLGGIAVMLYLSFKKTSAERLKLSEISALCEDQFFGRRRLRIKLHNGKSRDLVDLSKESDMKFTKAFFKERGIPII
ncbi:hypothetical protein [Robertkochia sediminum]|uniref:hypothetical protein n=1 Tax=Robertkochia sediminum TaxID=2785326 RepID=UPI0019312CDF|nr:hypothetical protein [Robertkochia sediminum]MBL7472045.1 hypothetical protein [Robertkochia sediminum]